MAKILIVEDDEQTRFLLQSSLANHNHSIAAVKNGREAIQMLIMEQPDLVLLDMMMPGVDGAEVIRTIRSTPELEAIPIIVVSGVAQPESIPEISLADLILSKPIPIDNLLVHIHNFL